MLERLAAAGVDVHVGNRAEHVPADADAVVYSTAIPLAERRARRRAASSASPVLHRSAALAALAATRRTIAVAGSHGKTTTSSMLALILRGAGLAAELRDRRRGQRGRQPTPPTARASGSSSRPTRATARSCSSAPEAALVTNVEPDHLDHYGGFDRARRARSSGSSTACRGPVVCCADDRGRGPHRRARAHASAPTACAPARDYRIVDEVADADGDAASRSSVDGARARRARGPVRR